MFAIALFALLVAITPFAGPTPAGSVAGTAKFSVAVRGESGQAVRLRAVGVPPGYIASFCTSHVCAPFNVAFALPKSGHESIELQLIEGVAGAQKPTTVTVAADGAPNASILFSRATR